MRLKIIFWACLGCCFISCTTTSNNPDERLSEAQKKGRALTPFLTENYTQGDSVYLITETGIREGFVVEENEYSEIRIAEELEGGKSKPIDASDVLDAHLSTSFRSQSTRFCVVIDVAQHDDNLYVHPNVYVNEGFTGCHATLTETDGRLTIQTEDGKSCVLKKGVGVVSLSTKDGKMWTLK